MRSFPQKCFSLLSAMQSHVPHGLYSLGKELFTEKLCPVCHVPFHAPKSSVPYAVETFLCSSCSPLISKTPHAYCTLCGHALVHFGKSGAEEKAAHCLHCQAQPPPWDVLSFYASYESLLKHCILQYKYNVNISMLPMLSAFLYAAALSLPPCDILIPMPRHAKRLASQGYNHMGELTQGLQKWLTIPVEGKALWRTRYTVPQISLAKTQRQKNPRKSFAAQHVQGKRVLLLDDVITTGATLHYASLALRQAGASHIAVLLLARAEK